jgi:hypothetical protein
MSDGIITNAKVNAVVDSFFQEKFDTKIDDLYKEKKGPKITVFVDENTVIVYRINSNQKCIIVSGSWE